MNGSAVCNIAQLVGHEDGSSFVPVGDWAEHLKPFCRTFSGIKSYQHFRYVRYVSVFLKNIIFLSCRFTSEKPGFMMPKATASGVEEQPFQLCKEPCNLPSDPPTAILPPGLDQKRLDYLYKNIRQFVDEPFKDIVCPDPETFPPVPKRRR